MTYTSCNKLLFHTHTHRVQFPSAFGATGIPGHVPPRPNAQTDTTDSGSSPRMSTTAEGVASPQQTAPEGSESGSKVKEMSSSHSSSTLSSTSGNEDCYDPD